MIRAIMHGCNGRMGRVITEMTAKEPEMEIVAGVDAYTETPNTYPVFEKIEDCDVEADVIIDFSNAAAADTLLDYAAARRLPLVLCTTGLSEEQLAHVEAAAKETAVLRSANMSMGINLLLKLLRDASRVLAPAGFDIEIVERHHNQKLDAPSGTAKMLAKAVEAGLDFTPEYVYERESKRQKRDHKEIGMHAIRGGTIVGEHEIIFAGRDEIITISHSARSKEIFAVGALNAAKFIADKDAGRYAMPDMIG